MNTIQMRHKEKENRNSSYNRSVVIGQTGIQNQKVRKKKQEKKQEKKTKIMIRKRLEAECFTTIQRQSCFN